MEYYECGYYHGNNRWSGHRFATESPSQQPSRPTTLPPSDPEPVTQNEPEPKPEPVTQNEPEPEPTPTTPAPSTPSPTEDSDDDDDDSDETDDDDDDDDETVVTPPRPVLCGNSWTGAGACIHNRITTSRNAHRITCSAGHTYWICNRTATEWHATSYLCTRTGCNQTYTKCVKGNGSCSATKPGGGTYQWHN